MLALPERVRAPLAVGSSTMIEETIETVMVALLGRKGPSPP